MRTLRIAAVTLSLACAALSTAHSQLVRSGTSATAAGLVAVRDQFRVDLGGGAVAGANGSFGGVRREINWDGVGDAFSAPNNLPANFFNVNSPRGVVFTTPGTGFQLSSTAASGVPKDFGNVDASYTGKFEAFSAERLFRAVGSNVLDVLFFLPGTNLQAFTRGFGVVFSDVDVANTTSIEYFGANGASLGTFFAPNVASGEQTFSFLGVSYGSSIISRVRITSGNTALGAGVNETGGIDLVVMDDFIYGEAAVPEPGAVTMLASAGIGLFGFMRARRRR
jgi:hypothetical protein